MSPVAWAHLVGATQNNGAPIAAPALHCGAGHTRRLAHFAARAGIRPVAQRPALSSVTRWAEPGNAQRCGSRQARADRSCTPVGALTSASHLESVQEAQFGTRRRIMGKHSPGSVPGPAVSAAGNTQKREGHFADAVQVPQSSSKLLISGHHLAHMSIGPKPTCDSCRSANYRLLRASARQVMPYAEQERPETLLYSPLNRSVTDVHPLHCDSVLGWLTRLTIVLLGLRSWPRGRSGSRAGQDRFGTPRTPAAQ